jgi:hypothetical protein
MVAPHREAGAPTFLPDGPPSGLRSANLILIKFEARASASGLALAQFPASGWMACIGAQQ